jgi:hypothetical protein
MASVPRPAAFKIYIDHPQAISRASWFLLVCAIFFSLSQTMGRRDIQVADFGAYYHAAEAVQRGQSPYFIQDRIDGSFVYSPAFACLFTPLHFLDYLWACRLWTLINWGLSFACLALAFHLALGWRASPPWDIIWLTLVPMENYFWANVRVGQTGVLMTAAILAWASCRRRGWPFLGGLALAGACAVKIAPLLLFPYLVVRRDWRGLSGILLGGTFLVALPAMWFGWEGTVRLHEEWAQQTLRTQVPGQTIRASNQSFLGQIARLSAISNGRSWCDLENLNMLQRAYPILVLGLAAILYGWIVWHARRPGDVDQQQRRENLHLCLLFIFMTLAHPRAWSCNFVALLLPTIILAETVCRGRPGWRVALVPIVLMALASALKTIDLDGDDWTWPAWLNQGRHFWAALSAALGCCWVYFCRSRRSSRTRSSGTSPGLLSSSQSTSTSAPSCCPAS